MAGGWYKVKQMGSIQLQSGGIIEEIEANGSYKYLGVEELDAIKHSDIKVKIQKDEKALRNGTQCKELNPSYKRNHSSPDHILI